MQTSDREGRRQRELERGRQGEAIQVFLTRFLGIDNSRKKGEERGQCPIEEGQGGRPHRDEGEWLGLLNLSAQWRRDKVPGTSGKGSPFARAEVPSLPSC